MGCSKILCRWRTSAVGVDCLGWQSGGTAAGADLLLGAIADEALLSQILWASGTWGLQRSKLYIKNYMNLGCA